jgi:hyperosmotically inducible protein
MKSTALVVLCLALAACGKTDASKGSDYSPSSGSDDSSKTYLGKSAPETNTERNVLDRDAMVPTPTDQGSSQADIDRTADIRRKVVDAKLSTNAENVKIVTMNGRVTLRGPVKSQAEKDRIFDLACEVAGESNVTNSLDVETVR